MPDGLADCRVCGRIRTKAIDKRLRIPCREGSLDTFEEKLSGELSGLTKDQFAAVMHGCGRAVCLAGPGSGKTRVISLRAARLWYACENGGRGSEKNIGAVLTLSFNRPACGEMRSRGVEYIKRLGGRNTDSAGFFTVHAYCYRLLREYLAGRGSAVPRVLDPDETSRMIEGLYGQLSGGRRLPGDEMKKLKSFILTETGEPDFEFGGLSGELAVEISKKYTAAKRKLGLIDFGDMLGLTLEYLRDDEKLRKRAKTAYAFTQVDEAQDLSEAQAGIIELISNGNILYVADDDQSIYGFRGANPGAVRSLVNGDHNFKTYMLEKNFRSGSDIVSASSWFIRANDDRFAKKISAARQTCGEVTLRYFRDTGTQAAFCAELLKKRALKKRSACVLYRNNVSGLPVLAALYFAAGKDRSMIPRVRGERTLFSESGYVKKLYDEIKRREEDLGNGKKAFAAVPLPYDIYRRLEREKKIDLIAAAEFGGRRPFLKNAVMCAAETVLKHSLSADEFLNFSEEIDNYCDCEAERLLNLSTVHSAKGLEYDTVVIIDCVEGEFPFGDVRKEEHLREERRLMYVAMTRAKNELTVACPGRCGKMLLNASRFAGEIEDSMR